MERWYNKVAVVTGASSGIGATIVKDFINSGLFVVGLARREERLQQVRQELPKCLQSNFHAVKCDISNEDDVKNAFKWINENLGGTDILVNNAGVMRSGFKLISPDNTEPLHNIFETNTFGIIYCTREAFDSMKHRNFDGHVVIINSILGHKVANFFGRDGTSSTNLYSLSKYSVTAMVDTYRQEFFNAGTKVRVTSISPGVVDTEFIADEMRELIPLLKPEDISAAVMYAIGAPSHVQVHDIIIKPIGERI